MGNPSGKMRINIILVSEEGTVASWLVVYELPQELFSLLDSGERSLLEISWKIKHDCWPPTEKEINKIKRGRAKETTKRY